MASTEPTLPMIRALIGIIGLLGIAYLFSSDRRKINLRVVVGGFLYKIIIAFGVLRIEWIESLFGWMTTFFR